MATDVRRWPLAAALLAAALSLGGCDSVTPKDGPPVEQTVPALSDEQARAQVVDPAKRLVAAAGWQNLSAVFRFSSCNDQGDPPFRGLVEIGFVFPPGADERAEVDRIAALLVADGWTDGPPAGAKPHGHAVHRAELWANVAPNPNHPGEGDVKIYGECGNQTDHRADGTLGLTDIADELRA